MISHGKPLYMVLYAAMIIFFAGIAMRYVAGAMLLGLAWRRTATRGAR